MNNDQITALAEAIMNMAEQDRGLVKSKLEEIIKWHVCVSERTARVDKWLDECHPRPSTTVC